MMKRIAAAMVLACLAAPALAQLEAAPPQQAAPAEPENLQAPPSQVLVSGKRPGPGVWKVSKDGHVMWVFGVYSPLPRDMEWDAVRVERLVAQSQALLLPPSASAKVGFWKGLTLLPQLPRLIGIQNNPDGATLHDVLPAEVYARWTVLKAKYIGEDKDKNKNKDIERQRPIFVGQRLMQAGRDKYGLSTSGVVKDKIYQIARANKLKFVASGFEIPLDNVGKAISEFKQNRLNDVACFSKTMDTMEDDIDAMRVRANAWANGNIADIEKLDFNTLDDACDEAILGSTMAQQVDQDARSMRERLRAAWLDAAEQAMAKTDAVFAVLDMKDVFDQKGYLAALQARGYTVDAPR